MCLSVVAIALDDWVSRSHSSAPDVSLLCGPTLTMDTGTWGRLNAASAVRRSVIAPVTWPSVNSATAVLAPVGVPAAS